MVEHAARKYPSLDLAVEDVTTFRSSREFDAVFSNAALHWIKDAGAAVESVRLALRPGGRFVAELGGRGNVAAVVAAVTEALAELGISAAERDPWYFPSLAEYAGLLERSGFRVVHAEHFDRPTPLEGGEAGLLHWLETFGEDFFRGISGEERSHVLDRVLEKARPALYRDGTWTVDYVRLRVAAVKG